MKGSTRRPRLLDGFLLLTTLFCIVGCSRDIESKSRPNSRLDSAATRPTEVASSGRPVATQKDTNIEPAFQAVWRDVQRQSDPRGLEKKHDLVPQRIGDDKIEYRFRSGCSLTVTLDGNGRVIGKSARVGAGCEFSGEAAGARYHSSWTLDRYFRASDVRDPMLGYSRVFLQKTAYGNAADASCDHVWLEGSSTGSEPTPAGEMERLVLGLWGCGTGGGPGLASPEGDDCWIGECYRSIEEQNRYSQLVIENYPEDEAPKSIGVLWGSSSDKNFRPASNVATDVTAPAPDAVSGVASNGIQAYRPYSPCEADIVQKYSSTTTDQYGRETSRLLRHMAFVFYQAPHGGHGFLDNHVFTYVLNVTVVQPTTNGFPKITSLPQFNVLCIVKPSGAVAGIEIDR